MKRRLAVLVVVLLGGAVAGTGCDTINSCSNGPAVCTAAARTTPSAASLAGSWRGRGECVDLLALDADGGFSWMYGPGCPAGLQCVWEGFVTNRGLWSADGGEVALNFTEPDLRGPSPMPATLTFSDSCGAGTLTYAWPDGGLASNGR